MTLEIFFAVVAFVVVIGVLLFISAIHLFMIPKDVMKRETRKNKIDQDQTSEVSGEDS